MFGIFKRMAERADKTADIAANTIEAIDKKLPAATPKEAKILERQKERAFDRLERAAEDKAHALNKMHDLRKK